VTLQISVIIPAIDEAQMIGAAVRSAVSAGADEVIVSDGGSHDGTPEIAQRHGARVLTAAPGRASQQNAGADVAVGDVLLFLHADCCLPKAGLSEIRQQLVAQNTCIGGYFRQRIDDSHQIYRWIESGNLMRAQTLKWAYGDQAIFVRADIFHDIGGFPDMPLMEDLFIMKRLRKRGQLVRIDAPLLVSARRWENRGTIRQTLRNWAMLVAVHLGVPPAMLARHYPRTT
jgi:rSAM/selenodomain-associated transferase 2